MQYSQEHLKTMVYAVFGGQTECIMGNWKIANKFLVKVCRPVLWIMWAGSKCYFLQPFLDLVSVSNNHERGQDQGGTPLRKPYRYVPPKG